MIAKAATTVTMTMPAIKPPLGDFDFDAVIACPVGAVVTVCVITTPPCVISGVVTTGVDAVIEEPLVRVDPSAEFCRHAGQHIVRQQ